LRDLLIKILLSPLTLVYGLGISLRDFFYSKNLLKGVEFDLPVISVGNLSMGGAGKTPHVEYIVRLLKDYIHVATLSRGYKRKTKGFRMANEGDTVETIGDEPLQFFRKFPDITVVVGESRMFAIPQMITEKPSIQTIILDDAFQHRSVKPGLNILLTQYRLPFTRDWLLPSGRLREWRSAYQRADIIIVTKCPRNISETEKTNLIKEIKPLPNQKMFFSEYENLQPYKIFSKEPVPLNKDANAILVCALANADYLADYLESEVNRIRRLEFADHHSYTNYDISRLLHLYQQWNVGKKIIITTEKDATRLEKHKDYILKHNMPIYVMPAKVSFVGSDGIAFDQEIKDFLLQFKV
jgi:tetraacyldisaccharide 4'-kinase